MKVTLTGCMCMMPAGQTQAGESLEVMHGSDCCESQDDDRKHFDLELGGEVVLCRAC